jgi:hypothetical protein
MLDIGFGPEELLLQGVAEWLAARQSDPPAAAICQQPAANLQLAFASPFTICALDPDVSLRCFLRSQVPARP